MGSEGPYLVTCLGVPEIITILKNLEHLFFLFAVFWALLDPRFKAHGSLEGEARVKRIIFTNLWRVILASTDLWKAILDKVSLISFMDGLTSSPKMGSNRAQNTAKILSGFLFFLGLLMYFEGSWWV